MIKLLASDLDGTIIDSNNEITQDNIKAINKINREKTNFTICTGKTYSMTKDICDKLNATYGIFGNGTQIINLKTGKEIVKNIIQNDQVIECIKIANNNKLHVHIYTEDKLISEQVLKYMAYRNYVLYNQKMNFEVVPSLITFIKENKPHVLKLVISGEKDLKDIKTQIEKNKDVCAIQIKKYNEYKDNIINQEYEYLDIVPKNVTKYEAIQKLSAFLEINKEEIMAVGDNINDIEMIKNAGIGVAIGNSYDEVKKVASYVTEKNVTDGGFAEAVYKFIEL